MQVAFYANDSVVVLGSHDKANDPLTGEPVPDLLRDARSGQPISGAILTCEVHSGPLTSPPDNSSPLANVSMSEQEPGIYYAELAASVWTNETDIYFRIVMTSPSAQEWYSGNVKLKYRTG